MNRTILNSDHADFRLVVREFVRREVHPHLDGFYVEQGLSREFWLAAGSQGLLGLEIPVAFSGVGAGDFRFNAVLMEELAAVNMALPSCVGIHSDIVPP